MTENGFSVLTTSGHYELREKKSRFLAVVAVTASDSEARSLLADRRTAYPDASHHCWALRLGVPPEERSSDAGEPAGTAGRPMLQVLRGAKLTNVIGIVSRWFGGTKLGKGGLARAYATSIREALRDLQVEAIIPTVVLDLEIPLSQVGELQRIIHPPEVEIVEEIYARTANISVRVAQDRLASIEEALRSRQISPKRRG